MEVINMPRKIIPFDLDYVKELYLSGKTIEQIASIIGVSKGWVEVNAKRSGLRFSSLRPQINSKVKCDKLNLPVNEIVSMYTAGMPKHHIALHFGVADMTINDRLKSKGIMPDINASESAKTRAMRMTIEERQQLTKNAHSAVRNSTRSISDLTARAIGVEKAGKLASGIEIMFSEFLKDSSVNFIPQKAIGIYNCDFAVGTVAVELFGGGFHSSGRHAARLPDRTRYILNSGFNMYIIWVYSREKFFCPAVLDDFITFNEQSRIDPTFVGQYRVVGVTVS
jgi:hypothetical protein